jgi:hypothetical protein
MGNLGVPLISLNCVEHSLDQTRKLRAQIKGPIRGKDV